MVLPKGKLPYGFRWEGCPTIENAPNWSTGPQANLMTPYIQNYPNLPELSLVSEKTMSGKALMSQNVRERDFSEGCRNILEIT
jgi:hypothetical protein